MESIKLYQSYIVWIGIAGTWYGRYIGGVDIECDDVVGVGK